MERIRHRGVKAEQNIERAYLEELVETYTKFFHYFDQAPLLIVNAADIDLVNNEEDYKELLRFVRTVKSGRHYYNPKPSFI